MNIRRKLILAFVAVAFIVIAVGYISWDSNKRISDDIEQITASTKELHAGADMAILATEIESAAQELATRYRHTLTNGGPERAIAEARRARISISEKFERLQQQLELAQVQANERIRMSNDQGDLEEIDQAKNTI